MATTITVTATVTVVVVAMDEDGDPLSGALFVGMAGDSKARDDYANPPENTDNCTFEMIDNVMAEGGATASIYAGLINTEILGRNFGPDDPDVVTFNLGINDCPSLPSEADWKEDILYVWDSIHAKWENAQIWVMLVWGRNYDDECDTIDGWLLDLIALRSFVYEGPDERIWMEGGDNGVTMTSDGIHPNATGQAEASHQWSLAFGCC